MSSEVSAPAYFNKEILPVLTPLAVAGTAPLAAAAGVAVARSSASLHGHGGEERIAVDAGAPAGSPAGSDCPEKKILSWPDWKM